MLDDLRNSTPNPYSENIPPERREGDQNGPNNKSRFLGMTAFQRFVIVFLLFCIGCVLVSFCLLLTEKIVLPFF
jgi:hypothetical protein